MSVFSAALKKFIAPDELLPAYHRHVDERVLSMDNERLLGVIVLQGVPFETTTTVQLEQAFNSLTRVFSEINKINAPRLAQWCHIIKQRVSLNFDYEFENAFIADFSNWGSSVQVAAPGVCILSTFPIEQGEYGTISGTSMASPHAAGALALLASRDNPGNAADVGALYAGVVTAGKILGRDLLGPIARGDVLGDPSLLPETPADYDPWRESH